MKFRIADITNRKNTNLTKYTNAITQGVRTIFPNAIVTVYTDYFNVNLTVPCSKMEIRKMGKEIVANSVQLRNLCKIYRYTRKNGQPGKSVQLFRRFI